MKLVNRRFNQRELIRHDLYRLLHRHGANLDFKTFRAVLDFCKHGEPELAFELFTWVAAENGLKLDAEAVAVFKSLYERLEITERYEPKYRRVIEIAG